MRMIFGTIAAAVALAVDFALLPLLLALAAGVILPRKQDGL